MPLSISDSNSQPVSYQKYESRLQQNVQKYIFKGNDNTDKSNSRNNSIITMMEELELDHERAKDQEEEKEQEEEVVVVEIPKPSKKPTVKGKEKKKKEVQFKLTAFFKKK